MSSRLSTPCLCHSLLTLLSRIDNHQCILRREQCRILEILDQHNVGEYLVNLSFVDGMSCALAPGCVNKHRVMVQRKVDLLSVRGKIQLCLVFGSIAGCCVQNDTVELSCLSDGCFVCVGSSGQSCRWSPFINIHDVGCCAQRVKLQFCF